MKRISGIFLKGLAAILPIAVTLYLLYWTGAAAEAVLGAVLRQVLPDRWYVPGMGLAAGVALIFLVGVLLSAYLVQKLWELGERVLNRIPFVKTIYGATQDLMVFFSNNDERALGQVVTVPVGDTGYRLIGFVTREDLSDMPEGLNGEDVVAVYTPLSYQIGGYTLLVPKSAVTPVEMSVEQAMRFALTAGVSTGRARVRAQASGKGSRAPL